VTILELRRGAATLAAVAFLAGCGGQGSSAMPSMQQAGTPGAGGAGARIVVKIAKNKPAGSLKFVVTPLGGRPLPPVTLALSNTTCPAVGTQPQCTLTMPLGPGAYTMSVASYASATPAGSANGPLQDVPFSVGAGRTATVAMILGATPASLAVAGANVAVHGSQSAGFTTYSTAAAPFAVVADDAAGNAIVGPGSPTFAETINGGGWNLGSAQQAAPSAFALVSSGTTGSSATVQVAAQYTDTTCEQPGAQCTASFTVTSDVQSLFVANCIARCNNKSGNGAPGSVNVYAAPYTGAPQATISNGVVQPIALLTDANADLFVANAFGGARGTGSITIYAPPYTGAPVTIVNGVDNPSALALDGSGNLWVANQAGNGSYGTIAEYAPPFTGGALAVIPIAGVPTALAFDPKNDLFVADGNALIEYAPPYNGPSATIVSGLAVQNGMTFDTLGNLFYIDSNGTVATFAPPYTGAPMQLQRTPGSVGLVATYAGMLFVPDSAGTTQAYSTPFTAPPQPIPASGPTAKGIAIDGAGNVFVNYCESGCAGGGADAVTMYAPPYTGGSVSLTNGVSAPSAITLTK
jgi:hypothetical protein